MRINLTKIIVYALLASFVIASAAMFVGCSTKKKATERYAKSEKSVIDTSFKQETQTAIKKDCTAIYGRKLQQTKKAANVTVNLVDPDKPGSATKTENQDGSTTWELQNASISESSSDTEKNEITNDSIHKSVTDNSTDLNEGQTNLKTENEASGRNSNSDASRFPTGGVVVLVILTLIFFIYKYFKK
ncbi:hypothetical protein ACFSYG_11865 [Leeuwenhoekiella polynyae]|uniref:Lipoprotein n=1 Tax=Leeuwenhoekiella polynyae TaxID=1550906 RepID=A0A4Q0PGG3_9FLAO|nr:hypothetical protein [Leeuwenhoekiella polynyae]RXG25708.1 hypothetical protein DSM02_875 [Leeuwenhoekiella polynyae]